MGEKIIAVSAAWKAAAAVVAVGLVTSGCSLPGMSFQGKPAPVNGPAQGFEVQPITPALLSKQAASRQQQDIGAGNPALAQSIKDYSYVIRPQDVLAVTVWGHPEFSPTAGRGGLSAAAGGGAGIAGIGESIGASRFGAGGGGAAGRAAASQAGFTVETDGSIFFPYVGQLQVAGMTVPEVRDELTKALAKYVVDPQVSVNVIGFNSQTYELAGSVRDPGLYPITNVPVTVSQAIQNAGGVLQTIPNVTVGAKASAMPLADLSHVLYIHDGKSQVLDLRAFFNNGDESQDRLVHPGDIIQVPNNNYDVVHMIGEIRDPGDYPLNNGQMNLAEALSRAGGINLVTANPSRIFVFRGNYKKPEIFWLDARSPVTMLLANQFQLDAQDVVYVATAGVSTWNRIITQILPTVEVLSQTKNIVK